MKKFNISSFKKAKDEKNLITMLTAYDYSMAKIVDEAGIDVILVGDSLGMVVQGYDSTLEVTLDDMIYHTKAVSRGVKSAMVIADMPFLTYHISIEDTIKNAGRLIQEGKAEAVKVEGGTEIIDKVKGLISAKIPVMGHIGLTPQSVNIFGGFKVQGKVENEAKKIINDAIALEEAGIFSIVLEGIPEKLAKIISDKVSIPTIGIGAGVHCDGQVLVINDMLGMYSDFTPKFVKKYANINIDIEKAIKGYIKDVKNKEFPSKEHIFTIDDSVVDKLY